jgi:hypothetical protein
MAKSRRLRIGDRVRISCGSGTLSDKEGWIADRSLLRYRGDGVPKLSGHYKPVDWKREYYIRLDSGEYVTMYKERLTKVTLEGRV